MAEVMGGSVSTGLLMRETRKGVAVAPGVAVVTPLVWSLFDCRAYEQALYAEDGLLLDQENGFHPAVHSLIFGVLESWANVYYWWAFGRVEQP
jgi:hypothetical protein